MLTNKSIFYEIYHGQFQIEKDAVLSFPNLPNCKNMKFKCVIAPLCHLLLFDYQLMEFQRHASFHLRLNWVSSPFPLCKKLA